MALPILDGNQSATTLSTILSSGQHIPAHTVVSLGTQAITDITSAVSGTSVCVGSISISGTPSVTGSVSVLNFPASQSTTFGAVTGSVSVLNFPASQAVTFSAVTISNFPATQTIAGTVTANGGNFAYAQDEDTSNPSDRGVLIGWRDDANGSFRNTSDAQPLPISGTVTVGNTVTIAGTVTANPTGTQTIAGTVTIGAGTAQIGSVTASISNSLTISSLPAISGTVTVGAFSGVSVGSSALLAGGLRGAGVVPLSMDVGTGYLQTKVESLPALVAGTAQIGSVTASISNSVTIGSLPAISGTVTANVAGQYFDMASGDTAQLTNPVYYDGEIFRVSPSRPLPVALATGYNYGASVTANSSNGSLTTRFGSVTTANTAFATSAVTNANRKYLLIQNITTASNVITVGIGFTPTTTQGIQLFAGAGLTFEGTYIPTGAVNLLSSVTASCYTILEA